MTLLNSAYGQEAVPKPEGAFAGIIGPTRLESTPAWAKQPEAKKGAPNVLLVLIDDAGFGASSTFGGLAQTTNLDKLATSGVRYNRFHSAGIFSPTRAVLLSSLCVRNFLPVVLSIFDCLKWQSSLQFQTKNT